MLLRTIEQEYFEEMMTNQGRSLYDTSRDHPVMLVFLRHFGCTFCRESLSDISQKREEIEALGLKLVFVHMAEDDIAERYFKKYNLQGSLHISDPEQRYYKTFGLGKGTFTQLFGLSTWIRGFDAAVVHGHGAPIKNESLGDSTQMPGIFIIQNGEIKDSYIHKVASARPDYVKLAKCCVKSY
ncbi:MAG: redoxin domain-containing protein [Saprospiraceae bacterium]|nr:redoxin domain-containing protein [Saprospiraceae bacterium]